MLFRSLKKDEQARFHTKSGLLTADKRGDWIEMDFPTKEETKVDAFPELEKILGVSAVYIGKNEFDYLLEVETDEIVKRITPNFTDLKKISVRGIIVTSVSGSNEFDFISRFFAPGSGIDEDPVTGSAHCCLAPYWMKKLKKTEMLAYQASARGGIVKVRMNGNRVMLCGQAVTVLQGELL